MLGRQDPRCPLSLHGGRGLSPLLTWSQPRTRPGLPDWKRELGEFKALVFIRSSFYKQQPQDLMHVRLKESCRGTSLRRPGATVSLQVHLLAGPRSRRPQVHVGPTPQTPHALSFLDFCHPRWVCTTRHL